MRAAPCLFLHAHGVQQLEAASSRRARRSRTAAVVTAAKQGFIRR